MEKEDMEYLLYVQNRENQIKLLGFGWFNRQYACLMKELASIKAQVLHVFEETNAHLTTETMGTQCKCPKSKDVILLSHE